MDIGVISIRYARALLKGAMEQNSEEQVYRDMQTLSRCYIEVPDLRFTIDNPMLSRDTKLKVLLTAVGKKPNELTQRFLELVLKEGRASILQFMATSYITLYRKQKNITRGKLVTATSVSSDTEKKMRKLVESKTRGTVEFNAEVDPDIIGGFVLEYDTYRLDASVKTQLRKILTELKK